MDVAVRELKANLSAYLRRARSGELITVTDRGRPVAVLGPVMGEIDLSQGIAEGWITPAAKPGRLGPTPRYRGRMSIQEVLDEDRGE